MILNDCRADFESAMGLSTDALQLGMSGSSAQQTSPAAQVELASQLLLRTCEADDTGKLARGRVCGSGAQGRGAKGSFRFSFRFCRIASCALRPGPRQPGTRSRSIKALDRSLPFRVSGGNVYLGLRLDLGARSLAPEQVPRSILFWREPPPSRALPIASHGMRRGAIGKSIFTR